MKKSLIIAAILVSTFSVVAQNIDLRRKIEVSGTAELEITPDIINVTISLKEYFKGGQKINIAILENYLQQALADAGVNKDDFRVADISSWTWEDRKKNSSFLASKQYVIRFHDLNKYNQILKQLDARGIDETGISSYDHTKMISIKKELKIKALLAAKDKAEYLLSSVGEKLGPVLSISEVDNSNPFSAQYKSFANTTGYGFNGMASGSDSDVKFKTIKISFQVFAVFEIK